MKIEHVALWCKDLEQTCEFYTRFFGALSSQIYQNREKNFTSCFLCFESGARLELMHHPDLVDLASNNEKRTGWSHLAIAVGSEEKVIQLTTEIGQTGFTILSMPRKTGDGYFESVVFDPEGNRLEITV